MKYVFGPVSSRRLGRSLGVDPVPLKTCNWNCIYCQLGRSTPVVNVRREYFPREDILAEVRDALTSDHAPVIDWVTFVASGETTLHRSIGWLIRQVKRLTATPVAVITNGSLLAAPSVRAELADADAILPSLDAGTAALFRRMNRAHPGLSFERHVHGMEAFRREYPGRLWIEVMLVQGMNDGEQALSDLSDVLRRIGPDEIHILAPTRPPAECNVRPPGPETLQRAASLLGRSAKLFVPMPGAFDPGGGECTLGALISILQRHPMTQDEVKQLLDRWTPGQASRLLTELEASERVRVVYRNGVRFWSAAQAHFPDRKH